MTDSGPSEEPLQERPAGIPRRYAKYKPVQGSASPPATNAGGCDELLAYVRSLGDELPRSKEGLAALDHLLDGLDNRATLAELVRVPSACFTVTFSLTPFQGRIGKSL